MSIQPVERRLAAVLAMDVAGYSALMARDEVGTLARLKAVRAEVIDPALSARRGRLVKTTGDGLLVEFASAVDAVACAIAIQDALVAHDSAGPADRRLRFRMGINVGDVIIDGEDIHGDGVNIAARLESIVEPGSVAISANVQEQVEGKLAVELAYFGEHRLKNIPRPVRVWRYMPGAAADDIARSRDVSLVLPDKPSVAVLPFTNMSADREQEYFSDGITEDIITELSRIRGFLVIARNTTFVYKGRAVDVKQIGRELGVRYVLEGSVRKAGAQLRVTAQLIEAETNRHLWAERYDSPADDVFAIQDRITRSVVGCIAPELFVAEHERARRKPTHSLDAWECQVRALFLCNQQSRDATDRAIQLMERALALDPHYAQAHGLRAWVAIWRAFQGWEPMDRAIRIAGSEIALAQALASDEPWSLLAQAMVGFALRDNQLSVAAAERATHSSPNMAYAHGLLGVAHAFGGRPEQAIACVDHSVRLSPREMFAEDFHLFYAFSHFAAGRLADALRHATLSHHGRPHHPYPIILAMASAAQLGDPMAAEYRARLAALVPEMTAAMLEQTCPFCVAADRARLVEGARRAGLR